MIRDLEYQMKDYKIPRMKKKISEMKSRSQIRHRKNIYKTCLRKTIRSFPDAVHANVSILNLNLNLNYYLSENVLRRMGVTATSIQNSRNVATDHNYSCNGSNDQQEGIDESDHSDDERLILPNGAISARHKRCVAHVMDLYKISEKAYHELCLSCKGILPPLSEIRKERLLMSSEIPYIVNPTVSKLLGIFIIVILQNNSLL